MTNSAFDVNVIDDGGYGSELGRISPEGNVYGQTRLVRDFLHYKWWTGEEYQDVEIAGRADSLAELPADRPWGEIWQIPETTRSNGWGEYWYDSENEEWVKLKWFWTVYTIDALPRPGIKIGAAHKIKEANVNTIWDGFQWERYPKHSGLLDDEPSRHLPSGFLQMTAPDVRVTYYSPKEIGLAMVEGGSGKVWVNGEWIEAGRSCSVFNRLAAVNWDSQTNSLNFAPVEPGEEYWIYLANNDSNFNFLTGLPGDETHDPAPAWNYLGRMFLSKTPNVDGYLSGIGCGRNARLVGKIETDNTAMLPKFIRSVDISLVSRTVNFPETYRDYSDYQVQFVDESTLALKLLDGQYGQIAINRDLYYLGIDFDIDRSDPWVDWNDADIFLDGTALTADSTYYIYLPASIDPFNFNVINDVTGRPWIATDQDSGSNYIPTLDLRLRPFLSPKEPEHGRMSDLYPGYEARHIGMVRTDGNGNFINARDLSEIRQPQLNPSYFDGLAEISIYQDTDTSFKIARKQGTSGIVNVAGVAIQTFGSDDPLCFTIRTTDIVQDYTESDLDSPLSALDAISTYSVPLYVYLANDRSFWGDLRNKCFVSNTAPTAGYLSRNWTGNNARWLATLKVSPDGRFLGSFIMDSLISIGAEIDDNVASTNSTWSGARIQTALTNLQAQLGASGVFTTQQSLGLPLRLDYVDSTTIKLLPTTGLDTTVAFPDFSVRVIPSNGLSMTVSGCVAGSIYKVYLTSTGYSFSLTDPSTTYAAMGVLSPDKIQVGWITVGTGNVMHGSWNVYSYWNQPQQVFTRSEITGLTTELMPPGMFTPLGETLYLSMSPGGSLKASLWHAYYDWVGDGYAVIHSLDPLNGAVGYKPQTTVRVFFDTTPATASPSPLNGTRIITPGVIISSLTITPRVEHTGGYLAWGYSWTEPTGNYILVRSGNI